MMKLWVQNVGFPWFLVYTGSSRYVRILPKLVGVFFVNFGKNSTRKRKIQVESMYT